MNRFAVLSALILLAVGDSIDDSPKKIIRRETKRGTAKTEEHHKATKVHVHHSGGAHHHADQKLSHHKTKAVQESHKATSKQAAAVKKAVNDVRVRQDKAAKTSKAATSAKASRAMPTPLSGDGGGFMFGTGGGLKVNLLGGGPTVQSRGARSKSMITVYLEGMSGKRFLVDPASPHLPHMGTSQDDESLFNLLDSGDNLGSILMQSASHTTSEYVFDFGDQLQVSFMQDMWRVIRPTSSTGHGKIMLYSVNHEHYICENHLLQPSGLEFLKTPTEACEYKATVRDVAWGRSPNEQPVTTAVKIALTGVGGHNLKVVGGELELVNDDWTPEAEFTLIDSGAQRSLILASNGKYVREDDDGTLSLADYDPADQNQDWWMVYEEDGSSSFEANSGKYMIDNSTAATPAPVVPFISDTDARYHVGNAKKWKVTLVDIKFQL